jgi:hypothetical protein
MSPCLQGQPVQEESLTRRFEPKKKRPTDHKSLTMGLRTIKKAKRSSQKKYNEGWRRLAPNQFRLSKQAYEIVLKICELYKF